MYRNIFRDLRSNILLSTIIILLLMAGYGIYVILYGITFVSLLIFESILFPVLMFSGVFVCGQFWRLIIRHVFDSNLEFRENNKILEGYLNRDKAFLESQDYNPFAFKNTKPTLNSLYYLIFKLNPSSDSSPYLAYKYALIFICLLIFTIFITQLYFIIFIVLNVELIN